MEARKIELNTVKDLLLNLSSEIEFYQREAHHLSAEIKLESHIALLNLQAVIQKTRPHAQDVITKENVQPFLDFLINRWHMISKTDASYCHNPHTNINLLCYELAKMLEPLTGIHAFNLLMYDLPEAKTFMMGNQTLAQTKLQDFILSDDHLPIHVLETLCLEENIKLLMQRQLLQVNDSLFMRTHPLVREESFSQYKPLTHSEQNRLIGHSQEVYDYYNSFKKNPIRSGELKQALVKDLSSSQKIVHVQSSYGVAGATKLTNVLINEIIDHYRPNLFDLANLLEPALTRSEITYFLGKTKLNDYQFFRMISDIKVEIDDQYLKKIENHLREVLEELINRSQDYAKVNESSYIRTLLIIIGEEYKRYRSSLPEYTSTFGLVGSFFANTSAYSKIERLNANDQLNNFYCSDTPLHELEHYFEINGLKNKYWGALTESSWAGEASILSLLTRATLILGAKLHDFDTVNHNRFRPGSSSGHRGSF